MSVFGPSIGVFNNIKAGQAVILHSSSGAVAGSLRIDPVEILDLGLFGSVAGKLDAIQDFLCYRSFKPAFPQQGVNGFIFSPVCVNPSATSSNQPPPCSLATSGRYVAVLFRPFNWNSIHIPWTPTCLNSQREGTTWRLPPSPSSWPRQ